MEKYNVLIQSTREDTDGSGIDIDTGNGGIVSSTDTSGGLYEIGNKDKDDDN